MRWGGGPPPSTHPVLEPLEGEREVAAPLGGGQGVDLVDDHRLDAAQRLAGRRGEHEVERLGRGDEDVGRVAHEAGAARRPACRRCGCPTVGSVDGSPEPLGREADALQRAPAGSSRRRPPAPAAARRRRSACGACARRARACVVSRSMPHRNAASVLPEPVGARISVCSPPAMAGQPCAWAAVGSGNEVLNQARTGGENSSSGSGAATDQGYRRPLTAPVSDPRRTGSLSPP